MIPGLELAYSVVKDVIGYLRWKTEDKIVDFAWVEKSGIKEKSEYVGKSFAFVRPDRLESALIDGAVVVYDEDKVRRVRQRLVLRDGLILIAKKSN